MGPPGTVSLPTSLLIILYIIPIIRSININIVILTVLLQVSAYLGKLSLLRLLAQEAIRAFDYNCFCEVVCKTFDFRPMFFIYFKQQQLLTTTAGAAAISTTAAANGQSPSLPAVRGFSWRVQYTMCYGVLYALSYIAMVFGYYHYYYSRGGKLKQGGCVCVTTVYNCLLSLLPT